MSRTEPSSPPAGRRIGSTLLSMLASGVVGVVITWWIAVAQRVPVESDADLVSVAFGLPLPWITQDHSSNPFVAYPNEVELRLSGRTGIDYPTVYDWMPFLGDVVIWGVIAGVLGMVAFPAVVRALRARSAGQAGRSDLSSGPEDD